MPWQPVVLDIVRAVARDLLVALAKEVASDPDGFALRASARLRLEGISDRLRRRKVLRRFALPRELDEWRAYAERLPRQMDALLADLGKPMPSARIAERAIIFDPPLRVQLTSSNVRDLAAGLDPEGSDAMKAASNCMDELQRLLKELGFKAGHKDDDPKSDAAKGTDDHGPSRKFRERVAERRDRVVDACKALLGAIDVLLPGSETPLAKPSPK
ncbi:MAG: hypothetical protein IT379_00945 [Deltaproteobacteria bacterium]|nr:hypothetical protein [Deltaproteobacteria bacterium]